MRRATRGHLMAGRIDFNRLRSESRTDDDAETGLREAADIRHIANWNQGPANKRQKHQLQ